MKPRHIISTVLIIGIIILIFFLYRSIMKPVQFENEYNKRSTAVINKLKDIRAIQEVYRINYGVYSNDIDSLLLFLEEGEVNMVAKAGDVPDSLTEAQALRAGIISRDTIVVKPLQMLIEENKLITNPKDIHSLKYIPYSDNLVFDMSAKVITRSGANVPVFEATAAIETYTKGMNNQDVVNRKAELIDKNRYPGWKVGDINQPITEGNWE